MAELVAHALLGKRYEVANIASCCATKVHHDVGVNVRDLCTTDAVAFHSELVDKTSCSNAFDLSEDGAG